MVAFLIVRGPVSAVIYTVTFPLGVRGGREAGIGVATMAALLNIVWALSTLVAPIVAGALAQTVGDRAAYGLRRRALPGGRSLDRGRPSGAGRARPAPSRTTSA